MNFCPFIKIVLISLLLVFNMQAQALTPNSATTEEYLLNHGHSKEIIRMINVQKSRVEGKPLRVHQNSRPLKFLKNLYYAADLSLPTEDFGFDDVETVESDFNFFNFFKKDQENL